MAIRNVKLGGTDFSDGEVLDAADLNDTNDEIITSGAYGNVPIGTVQAWLKNYTNTPALPTGWVECNGQTLSDSDSVYNGQVIPDLNGAVGTGLKGYFLRGHSESGLTEDSQNLAHTHTIPCRGGSGYSTSLTNNSTTANTTKTTNSSGGTEARPHNYSVVWIMRVK